jgi:hypothetical protein
MEIADPLGLTVVCATIGLATYCLACALHVWRKRNREVSPGDQKNLGLRTGLRPVAYILWGLGLAGMAGAVLIHVFLQWEGILGGEQLFVVMKPREDLVLQHVAATQEIQQDAVVARFHPLEREAERPRAEARNARPAARRSVPTQRFLADSQISRELAELAMRQVELEMATKDVVLEASRLKRTTLEERLRKEDEIQKLDIDRQDTRNELDQAAIRLAFKRKQSERKGVLHREQLIATEQLQEGIQEVQVSQSEVAKLEERVKRLDALRSSEERGLETMEIANGTHGEALQRLLDKLGAQLDEVQARRRSLSALTDTMNVVAPFSGRVVYRDPSPTTVPANAPIMVIAPPDGLRVKIRMPYGQMEHLQQAGTVQLRLSPSYHVHREERQFIERRFTGRLLRWKALPDDPGFVVAEFACDPPAEAIREMVSGRQVVAQLRWIPPLFSIPAFTAGAGMVAAACVGVVLLQLMPQRRASPELSVLPPSPASVSNNGAGDEDVTLRALGVDLRELIRRRRLDGNTLPAAEWALGRYQLRAGRLLSVGLAFDSIAAAQLQEWARQLLASAALSDDDADREKVRSFRRLIRLLLAIAAEQHQPMLRRLEAAMAGRALHEHAAPVMMDARGRPSP